MNLFLLFFLSSASQRLLVMSSPVTVWPKGLYGLPKPRSGCPSQWKVGYRKQDLENTKPDSKFSSDLQLHMDANLTQEHDIERRFCVKDSHQNGNSRLWPDGIYCVYQKGGVCPSGMKNGFIQWDDEDQRPSHNAHNGTLPDGSYDKDTVINYCCQDRGSWNDPIELPVDQPFYLLPHKSSNCQRVKGATSTLEWITFDTEDDHNHDIFQQSHVFSDAVNGHPKIYYCYYVGKGCQRILKDVENGTVSASNFPSYQYCSWSITVKQGCSVHLEIISINIPNCGSVSMDIYDGLDDTAPLLITLCGVNATSGTVLRSSGNHMFITLRSQAHRDNVQFQAYYHTTTPSTGVFWPSGTYGLPKTSASCPDKWIPGWRKQIMEDDTGSGETSFSADLLAHMDINFANYALTRHFCIKTIDSGENQQVWPAGKYCIYKKNQCPVGMKEGSITMDDEDDPQTGANDEGGIIPDGSTFTRTETIEYYCCSDRGKWNESIELPTHGPFYLLPHQSKNCQRVKWALSTLDYITYDTESNNNQDDFQGSFPYKEGENGRPTILYCHYEGCRYEIDATSPSRISIPSTANQDFQTCSWLLFVNHGNISLTFNSMSVPDCVKDNYIEVYDGLDKQSHSLVRYCGSTACANVTSTGKHLFMLVKSGNNTQMGTTVSFSATFKNNLPSASPNTLPSTSPMTSSKTSPTTSPNTSPDTSPPDTLHTTSPRTSPNTPKTSSMTSSDSLKEPPTTSASTSSSMSPTLQDDTTQTHAALSEFTEMTKSTDAGVNSPKTSTEEATQSTMNPHESGQDGSPTGSASSLVIVLPVCITVLAIVIIVMTFYRRRLRKDDGNSGTIHRATIVSSQTLNGVVFNSPDSVRFEKKGGLQVESPEVKSTNNLLYDSEEADPRYQNNPGADTTDITYCTIVETRKEYEKVQKSEPTYAEPINQGASTSNQVYAECGI